MLANELRLNTCFFEQFIRSQKSPLWMFQTLNFVMERMQLCKTFDLAFFALLDFDTPQASGKYIISFRGQRAE